MDYKKFDSHNISNFNKLKRFVHHKKSSELLMYTNFESIDYEELQGLNNSSEEEIKAEIQSYKQEKRKLT